MRPDVNDLVTILVLLAIPLLLLPTWDSRRIPDRLRATARGDRHHVFGPPAGGGPLADDPIERWLQVMRRELPRVLLLGLPLHMLALGAEAHGARRRLARDDEWRRSAAGLLFELLTGRMNETELHERLRERGLPLPSEKLRWEPTPRLTMPPMEWRIEWDRHLESLGEEERPEREPAAPLAAPAPKPAAPPVGAFEVEIRALGGLFISSNGQDLAPGLMHRPALAFAWLYLMSREVLRAGDRIMRAVLGDILFPRIDTDRQREKLRGRLHELRNDLPEPLARRIKVEGDYVGFDLTGCDLDVRRVLALAEDVAGHVGPLTDELLEWIEAGARDALGEFLPGWEETERRATDAVSGADQVVADVRNQVAMAHVRLVSALATAYLARHQPDRAIPRLEEALRRRPERDDLARLLADAYDQAGQRRRAARVRHEYGLGEVSPME